MKDRGFSLGRLAIKTDKEGGGGGANNSSQTLLLFGTFGKQCVMG